MKLKKGPPPIHTAFNPVLFEFRNDDGEVKQIEFVSSKGKSSKANVRLRYAPNGTYPGLDYAGEINAWRTIATLFDDNFDGTDYQCVSYRVIVPGASDENEYVAVRSAAQIGETQDLTLNKGRWLTGFKKLKIWKGYPRDVSALTKNVVKRIPIAELTPTFDCSDTVVEAPQERSCTVEWNEFIDQNYYGYEPIYVEQDWFDLTVGATNPNRKVVLMNDLDFSAYSNVPYIDCNKFFGQGRTIKNAKTNILIYSDEIRDLNLFNINSTGYLFESDKIINCKINNCTASGKLAACYGGMQYCEAKNNTLKVKELYDSGGNLVRTVTLFDCVGRTGDTLAADNIIVGNIVDAKNYHHDADFTAIDCNSTAVNNIVEFKVIDFTGKGAVCPLGTSGDGDKILSGNVTLFDDFDFEYDSSSSVPCCRIGDASEFHGNYAKPFTLSGFTFTPDIDGRDGADFNGDLTDESFPASVGFSSDYLKQTDDGPIIDYPIQTIEAGGDKSLASKARYIYYLNGVATAEKTVDALSDLEPTITVGEWKDYSETRAGERFAAVKEYLEACDDLTEINNPIVEFPYVFEVESLSAEFGASEIEATKNFAVTSIKGTTEKDWIIDYPQSIDFAEFRKTNDEKFLEIQCTSNNDGAQRSASIGLLQPESGKRKEITVTQASLYEQKTMSATLQGMYVQNPFSINHSGGSVSLYLGFTTPGPASGKYSIFKKVGENQEPVVIDANIGSSAADFTVSHDLSAGQYDIFVEVTQNTSGGTMTITINYRGLID